jgi:CheY-like chemotaxis protein
LTEHPCVVAPFGERLRLIADRLGSGRPAILKDPAKTDDGRQPHILVVNDTQEILDHLPELLEEEGYRVSTFVETLNLTQLKVAKPDVIVQDLLFEGMQDKGWKFLTMARLDPDLRLVPLILCTTAISVVKDEDMAEKLRRLRVRVVLKPFAVEELLEVVAAVLAGTPYALE